MPSGATFVDKNGRRFLEDYDPKRWWRITVEGDEVVHEILGLINARLGFVAKPKE